jgi:hypothetical protein
MGILSSLLGGDMSGAGQGLTGILGSLGQGLSDNSGMLLGFAGGGPEGAIQGRRSDMLAAAQRQEQEDKAHRIAAAMKVAPQYGIDPEIARNDPEQAYKLIQFKMQKEQQDRMYGLQASENARQAEQFQKQFGLQERKFNEEANDPYNKYLRDLAQNNPDEFGALAKRKFAPSAGQGITPGYRQKADGSGWEPIPGGPHDPSLSANKPLPAELSGRVALAEGFLEKADKIRGKIAEGYLTGPIDSALASNGIGERGQVYADIQSGVDALQRGLTGAGMGEQEAARYAQRYQPTSRDNSNTLLWKHDRLVDELERIRQKAYEGRGKTERITKPETSPYDKQSSVIRTPYGTLRAKGQ